MTWDNGTVWEDLHDLVDSLDAAFECGFGTRTCWAGFLRVTLTNPEDKPSRSMTFYAAGEASAFDVAAKVMADYYEAREADYCPEPMPTPDWLRDEDGPVLAHPWVGGNP